MRSLGRSAQFDPIACTKQFNIIKENYGGEINWINVYCVIDPTTTHVLSKIINKITYVLTLVLKEKTCIPF